MKKIIELFCLDWQRIVKSKMTLTIIGGLMIIPSLYAWFNILALWDPYGSTSELPIAVVSEDLGYNQEDIKINVGDEVIASLSENNDIAWQFVSDKNQLNDGVNSGEYYAGIVIPSSFSRDLIEYIFDESKTKPQLEYYVNEKINAIAPKITDEGASSIEEEISTNFTLVVSESLAQIANDMGASLSSNEDLYNNLKAEINTAYNDLDEYQGMVDLVHEIAQNIDVLDDEVATINQYNKLSSDLQTALADLDEFVSKQAEVNASIEASYSQISSSQELNNASSTLNSFNDQLVADINTLNSTINTQIDSIDLILTNGADQLNVDDTQKYQDMKTNLLDLQTKLNQINTNVNTIKNDVDSIESSLNSTSSELKQFYQNEYQQITSDLVKLNETLQSNFPQIDQEIKADIVSLNELYPEIKASIVNLDQNLQSIWPEFQESLIEVHNLINQDEIDYDAIIKLLMLNPSRTGQLMSNPVEIKTTVKYHVPNYGSQSAPFYTALCLWVGAVLLTSVLSTKYHLDNSAKYTTRQMHIARLLTFLSIAIIQAIIVSVGNIYLLHAYTISPVANILSSIYIAICFNVIVYTLASLFDNIGKAVAVVLLVLSVAGGGGNFPIQLSSEFFQVINPLLPFTHAVNALRETVGGVYVPNYLHAMLVLSMETLLFLVLGTVFAPQVIRFTERLMAKTESSHIFH